MCLCAQSLGLGDQGYYTAEQISFSAHSTDLESTRKSMLFCHYQKREAVNRHLQFLQNAGKDENKVQQILL